MARNYMHYQSLDAANVTFSLGQDRAGKPSISMQHIEGGTVGTVAIVTPPCITNWPRCCGDGNYGTMWGPTDVMKAKFTLDLTDAKIDGVNADFHALATVLEAIDEKLLDFVHSNQQRILNRRNLSRDEVKMLQIRSVKPKFDKTTGVLIGHSVQLSAQKWANDGMGGKFARTINICDKDNNVVPNGTVMPGDVVAATAYVNQVYCGVSGDKFGVHWSFEDVKVFCQRKCLQAKTEVPAFAQDTSCYQFAQPYSSETTASVYAAA